VSPRQRAPSGSRYQDSPAPRQLPAVLVAWHDSRPDFSVHVGGRLRCLNPFPREDLSVLVLLVATTPGTITRPENGRADRIVTRRLRHSGSFAAGSPRALQESGKWVGSSRRSGRYNIKITFPGATCPPDQAFSTPLEPDRFTATAIRA
jgi:hypothetical protein